jgi:hypothetical protein
MKKITLKKRINNKLLIGYKILVFFKIIINKGIIKLGSLTITITKYNLIMTIIIKLVNYKIIIIWSLVIIKKFVYLIKIIKTM